MWCWVTLVACRKWAILIHGVWSSTLESRVSSWHSFLTSSRICSASSSLWRYPSSAKCQLYPLVIARPPVWAVTVGHTSISGAVKFHLFWFKAKNELHWRKPKSLSNHIIIIGSKVEDRGEQCIFGAILFYQWAFCLPFRNWWQTTVGKAEMRGSGYLELISARLLGL